MSARPMFAILVAAAFASPAAAQLTIPEKLAQKVDAAAFDGNFKDAVKLLAEKYDLPLVVDPSVGTDGLAAAMCDGADDRPVKWSKLAGIRVDTLLKIVCDQVQAIPLVAADTIRIVGLAHGLYETGVLKQPEAGSPFEEPLLNTIDLQKSRPLIQRALVNAVFKDKPLAEVLAAIAEATGANVALAPQAADAGKLAITVRFVNTPVDAAVRTLCEMADLGAIEDANVLLVTTKERAAARNKADEEKRKVRTAAAAAASLPLGFGGELGGGMVAAPADLAAEIARLRDQNDQLKKQLDEIHKLLKK